MLLVIPRPLYIHSRPPNHNVGTMTMQKHRTSLLITMLSHRTTWAFYGPEPNPSGSLSLYHISIFLVKSFFRKKHPPVGGCVHIIYNTYYIILIQWGAPMLLNTAFGIHRADQYLWGQDNNQHFACRRCIT